MANVATKPEGYILLFSTKAVDPTKHDVDPELLEMYKKLGILLMSKKRIKTPTTFFVTKGRTG
jgi:hypothetical protein